MMSSKQRGGRAHLPTRSKIALAAAGLAICAMPFAPAASAGKPTASGGSGGGGGGGFVVPDGVYGDTTTASVAKPPSGTWVVSTCYQAGAPVIFNRLEVNDLGEAVLTLGPTDGYTSGIGGADCDAEAKYWHMKRQRWISIATTTFHVSD